jgi:hypothetical protein
MSDVQGIGRSKFFLWCGIMVWVALGALFKMFVVFVAIGMLVLEGVVTSNHFPTHVMKYHHQPVCTRNVPSAVIYCSHFESWVAFYDTRICRAYPA